MAGMNDRVCIVDGCGRGGKLTRGMCAKDYRYWLDHTPRERRGLPPRASRKFDDFVARGPGTRCWVWAGPVDRGGYGRWGKKLAHRVAFARANGFIPEGASVLHRCDNPPCVNPKHLYAGTASDNMNDALARGRHPGNPRLRLRARCPRGHEFAGSNLIVRKDGSRICRACDNPRKAESARLARRAAGPLLRPRLTEADAERIRMLRQTGMSHRKIAVEAGRSLYTVQRVLAAAP